MRDRTAESNPASVFFGHMLSPHVALVAATRSPARTPAASAAPPGATRTTKSPADSVSGAPPPPPLAPAARLKRTRRDSNPVQLADNERSYP